MSRRRDWARSNWRQRIRERGCEDVKGGGLPFDLTERPKPPPLSKAQLRKQAERAMAEYARKITKLPPAPR